MDNPATIADIEARWRPLTAEETIIAAALLNDAWAIMQNRLPGLVAGLTAVLPAVPTIDVNLVRMVLANMVMRVLRNVEGMRSETIAGYSYTVSDSVAAGYLFLSADDLGLLLPVGSTNGAYTIRPYRGDPYVVDYEPTWIPQ